MAEHPSRAGQLIPSFEWEKVRALFPWRSAVLVVDGEANTREFLLLSPKSDCSDIDLDGRVLSAAEAAELLKDQEPQALPPYLQREYAELWATQS